MDNLMYDVANLQAEYRKLVDESRLSKKAMCDLVIPFRDKYRLKDGQALQIARDELSISEINNLLNKESEGNQ